MKRYIKAATYNYAGMEFDYSQMRVINKGLEAGVDVSIYANPKFSAYEMEVILLGLKDDLDVKWLANPEFSDYQMSEILVGLYQGLDVSTYANPSLSPGEMVKIRNRLAHEKNVPQDYFTDYTSKEVISGIEDALNVSPDIAKIIAKWYATEDNPNGYETVSEYVQGIADDIEYHMNELYLNEGMEGLRDIDPKYAEEFVQVADALGIELDEEW
jgi:hypothetical protein